MSHTTFPNDLIGSAEYIPVWPPDPHAGDMVPWLRGKETINEGMTKSRTCSHSEYVR